MNGIDCDPFDGTQGEFPSEVTGVGVTANSDATISWDDQSATAGSAVVYDLVTGNLLDLHTDRDFSQIGEATSAHGVEFGPSTRRNLQLSRTVGNRLQVAIEARAEVLDRSLAAIQLRIGKRARQAIARGQPIASLQFVDDQRVNICQLNQPGVVLARL